MNAIIDKTNWMPFLKEYSAKNKARPTRLGVFEQADGKVEDLWIEDGLPLIAVDPYRSDGRIRIDIVLENYVHPVDDVVTVLHYSAEDEDEGGLDLVDNSGRTTILRFEDQQFIRRG